MSNDMMDMVAFFAQMEAEMLAKAKAEQAAEDAMWFALSPEEKARRIEAAEAVWASMQGAEDDDDDDDQIEEDDA